MYYAWIWTEKCVCYNRRFVITKFVITKFVITKFVITKFHCSSDYNSQILTVIKASFWVTSYDMQHGLCKYLLN